MDCNAIKILTRFEDLVKHGKISGFNVSLQKDGLLIKPNAGVKDVQEESIAVDKETLDSLKIFFYGVTAINHDTFDYISLVSLINAKTILERMLNRNHSAE